MIAVFVAPLELPPVTAHWRAGAAQL